MDGSSERYIRKSMSLPESLWGELSEYRHGQRIRSEAEASRRLLIAGLQAERKRIARELPAAPDHRPGRHG